MNTEIKIGGFGGQGVILASMIIGKAASIFDNKHAAMIQSFGPEARGSSCSAQLIVSDRPIAYPYVRKPDILAALSHDAYVQFGKELAADGILIAESDLVKLDPKRTPARTYSVPATRFAEELGRKVVTNIVMVGFFTAVTGLVSADAAANAVRDSVPKGMETLNLKAFEKGYEYGKSLRS